MKHTNVFLISEVKTINGIWNNSQWLESFMEFGIIKVIKDITSNYYMLRTERGVL